MNTIRHNTLRLILLATLLGASGTWAATETVTVYKSPSCGCCGKWVEHMRANGFTVQVINRDDLRMVKSMAGVPGELASCHTAQVGGYVIEGHVPAQDVRRLLDERPPVKGLAAPGMPMGAPGMEGPRHDHYRVLSFDAEGAGTLFAEH